MKMLTLAALAANPGLIERLFFKETRRCCCGCGDLLQAGHHRLPIGLMNDGCYWGHLGDEIERHPIGPGRRVRSACA